MKIHRITISTLLIAISSTLALAKDNERSERHDAFINSLREDKKSELLTSIAAKSVSKPKTLSPVVSRFKGWFIDITEKTHESKLKEVRVASGISLANKKAETSYWQFVETEKGYLVVSTGGKYKGWVIGRDDSAKRRPEGPNLTVAPALRLSKQVTANCYWELMLAEKGLVLKAAEGAFKGWVWDFGGGDPSHAESGREVAVNVLLAERIVAGSYFDVKSN